MLGIPWIRYLRAMTLRGSGVSSCIGFVFLDPLDVTSPRGWIPLAVPTPVMRESVVSARLTVDIFGVASKGVSMGLEGGIFLIDRATFNTMFSQMAARCKAPSSGIVWPPQEFMRV